MLIDRQLPDYEVCTSERVVVDAEPAQVWTRAMEADLRWRPRAGGVRLGRLARSGRWVRLDEDFGRELVIGAIGRPARWGLAWRHTLAAEFADFDEPGFVKLVMSFSLGPVGDGRTLLSCETRGAGTDPRAARRLVRLWRVASPLLARLLRRQLHGIREEAERQFGGTVPRPSEFRRR